MTDKFYGIWLPGHGWLRFPRQNPLGNYDNVAWATTEKAWARQKAREFNGCVKRIDEALGSKEAEELLKAAEEAAKESLWQRIRKVFHRDSLTS